MDSLFLSGVFFISNFAGTEVQSGLRPKLEAPAKFEMKKNPLKNKESMAKLNPGSEEQRVLRRMHHQKGSGEQKAEAECKRKRAIASKEHNKKHKKGDESFYKTLMKAFEAKLNEGEKAETAEDE